MNRLRPLLAALLAASLAALVACGPNETQAERAARDGILLLGNGAEPASLDPHVVTGVPESQILRALFEGLVAQDPEDLQPVPGVAESWDVSPDGLTTVFHLRESARWSDGSPVTAQDFVYAWRRALSPAMAGQYAYLLHPIRGARDFNAGRTADPAALGVRALDDRTLEVVLEAPSASFLHCLSMPIAYPVQQANIEAFGGAAERDTRWIHAGNMVSNGPFVLTEWSPNQRIAVEKNPEYWDAAAVSLTAVHFFPIENEQTEERLFRTGGLHVTQTCPIARIAVYKREQPDLIKINPFLGTYYYKFNTTKPPLDDPRVRRALAMAIDRKSIVENVTQGGEMPADSFTPPGMAGYDCRAAVPHDPEAARVLLAEAGYSNGDGMPPVEILYNTTERHRSVAEAIQQMWRTELGVSATLTNQDWKVYLANLNGLDYSVARAGWIGDYVDPGNFLDCLTAASGNNNTGYENPEYDALMAQASRTLDKARRQEIYQRAEKILLQDAPLAPIYVYTQIRLQSPHVRDWKPNLLNHHFYKQYRLAAD